MDTGFLKDGEIELVLTRTACADEIKQWLPAYYFDIRLADGTVTGSCDLRIGHNKNTYYGGNIGYEVIPEHRGRHYAAKACLLLFELARRHSMGYVIITCSPDNIASRRTCEYAGCTLIETASLPEDNEMYLEGARHKCVYRFEL